MRRHQAGRLEEAERLYKQILAINPGHADSLHLLGVIAFQVGRPEMAVDLIGAAIGIDGAIAVYHFNLGCVLHQLGQLDQAAACNQAAIALKPDYAEAHTNLGLALQSLGRIDEAMDCHRTAIGLKPDHVEAHNNLGVALKDLGWLDAAVESYRAALAVRPNYPEALSNLGAALQAQGRLAEALDATRKAIALKADYAEAHNNLGFILQEQGRLDEATDCYRRAIELRPDYAEANFNLGLARLLAGDFAAGWAKYEWRWKTAQAAAERRDFAQPQWQGEAGRGRTLLIHAEQGFGDTLQFCRYAPLAAARGWRVILEVQAPLVRLMGSLAGVERVVAESDPPPDFDRHCPMLSLPLALGTTLDTIPANIPYLHADRSQVAAWRARLDPGFRVGLVWAGNPRPHMPQATVVDRRRSIPADRLAPLANLPDIRFFSLQKGGPAAPADFPLVDVMDEMADFADTAALITTLDLVISVDTAVAHLAGALGRPVWLLNRFDSCWRWLRKRDDSPWYPTLRQFRQPRPGDWEAVIERVREELAESRCYGRNGHEI